MINNQKEDIMTSHIKTLTSTAMDAKAKLIATPVIFGDMEIILAAEALHGSVKSIISSLLRERSNKNWFSELMANLEEYPEPVHNASSIDDVVNNLTYIVGKKELISIARNTKI